MTDPERYLEAELERTRQERDDARCLLDEAVRLLREFNTWERTRDYGGQLCPWCDASLTLESCPPECGRYLQARAFLDLVEKKREFNMDGTMHRVGDPACCLIVIGRKQPHEGCGGLWHFQPVYDGYFHECDKCGLKE